MKSTIYLLLLVLLAVRGYAQEPFNQDTGNPNLDFLMGDFSHWQLSWITRDDPEDVHDGPASVSSPVIVENYGNNWDGNAGIGNLPRVPDGLEQVARFGDPAGSGLGYGRAYKMSYNITVHQDFPILFIQLASLMDNHHGTVYNTHYKFSLQTALGEDVPVQPCTGLELYPTGNNDPTAQSVPPITYTLQTNPSGNYNYQPWESIAIDLSGYVGQTLYLEFEHYDCAYGVHGSYTYLSAAMRRAVETVYFCKGETSVDIEPYIPRFDSYLWNTGDTTESITVNQPVDGAVYTVDVGSYNECGTTLTYELKEIETDAEFHYECGENNMVTFLDESITDYGDIETWSWDFDDPNSGNNTSNNPNPSHTFSAPGSYEVSLTVTNGFGCTSTYSQTIEIVPFSDDVDELQDYLDQNPIEFCENAAPDIHEVEALLNYIHTHISDILIDKTAEEILSEITQGQGEITIAISREGVCGSKNLYISYQTNPIPAISPLTEYDVIGVCWGENGYYDSFNLTLTGNEALGNLSPGDYSLSYYLTESAAEAGGHSGPDYIPNPTSFANTQAYQQQLWLRVENNVTGCYAVTDFSVQIYSSLEPIIQSRNGSYLCVDYYNGDILSGVELYIDIPGTNNEFQWYVNNTAIPNAQADHYTALEEGKYKVEVIPADAGNCPSLFSEEFEVEKSSPAAIVGEGYKLTANGFIVLVKGFGDYMYSLDPNGPWQSSNEFEVPAGTYTIYIKALNSNCEIMEIKNIHTIFVPKFFTPNGDGFNDYWYIKGVQFQNQIVENIEIYDRYGKLIIILESYGEWDGTFHGKPLPGNDYWYKIKLVSGYTIKGHLTLKR